MCYKVIQINNSKDNNSDHYILQLIYIPSHNNITKMYKESKKLCKIIKFKKRKRKKKEIDDWIG